MEQGDAAFRLCPDLVTNLVPPILRVGSGTASRHPGRGAIRLEMEFEFGSVRLANIGDDLMAVPSHRASGRLVDGA